MPSIQPCNANVLQKRKILKNTIYIKYFIAYLTLITLPGDDSAG